MSSVDEKALNELRELMEEGFSPLIRQYLHDAQAHIDQVKNAVLVMDRSNIVGGAHTLKGSSLNVGVPRLAELANALEKAAQEQMQQELEHLVNLIEAEFEQVKQQLLPLS